MRALQGRSRAGRPLSTSLDREQVCDSVVHFAAEERTPSFSYLKEVEFRLQIGEIVSAKVETGQLTAESREKHNLSSCDRGTPDFRS